MKLQLGIVNVGPAWQSCHQPALRALSDRFEIRAVCDAVRQRAEQVAMQFNAAVCDGYQQVVNRSDIDAVLLLSSHWYGAMPIFAACEAGKAVYSAAALDIDDRQADELRQKVQQAGIAFMAEFPCRMSAATLRLKELIATRLGQPRLLICNRRHIDHSKNNSDGRAYRNLIELVDWCRYVVGQEPTSLHATSHRSSDGKKFDFFALTLDFSATDQPDTGPLAQIGYGDYIPKAWKESASYRRPAELEVVCEGGIAFVELPNTVAWFDEAGQHLETLDHERPVGEQLLLHFHRAVESLVLKTANLDDAYRAITIANKARESCQEGRRVACDG